MDEELQKKLKQLDKLMKQFQPAVRVRKQEPTYTLEEQCLFLMKQILKELVLRVSDSKENK